MMLYELIIIPYALSGLFAAYLILPKIKIKSFVFMSHVLAIRAQASEHVQKLI
jgi:hypothetical protein